jgi:hypothetical protein
MPQIKIGEIWDYEQIIKEANGIDSQFKYWSFKWSFTCKDNNRAKSNKFA